MRAIGARVAEGTQDAAPEVLLGETDFRGTSQPFGLLGEDRLRHLWVLGKTGVGKSTLLANLMRADLAAGRGLAVFDPHGPLIDEALQHIPRRRLHQVLHLDPSDEACPVAFNPLRAGRRPVPDRALAASELLSVFRTQWSDSWGPRLEHVLRHALLAVLEHPEPTLERIYTLLVDADARASMLRHVRDPSVLRFWNGEFEAYGPRLQAEATAPVLNKLGAFLGNPRIAALVGRVKSRVALGPLMDEQAIVLADLRVGQIGEDASRLLGALLLSSLQLAAQRRRPGAPRFIVYVDEFQRFAAPSIATTLSESRKYGLGLVLAHQYLVQLSEPLQHAVLGNVGSIAAFRLGALDAERIATELGPPIETYELQQLPRYRFATRLIARGAELRPFVARSVLPRTRSDIRFATVGEVRAASRARFG